MGWSILMTLLKVNAMWIKWFHSLIPNWQWSFSIRQLLAYLSNSLCYVGPMINQNVVLVFLVLRPKSKLKTIQIIALGCGITLYIHCAHWLPVLFCPKFGFIWRVSYSYIACGGPASVTVDVELKTNLFQFNIIILMHNRSIFDSFRLRV